NLNDFLEQHSEELVLELRREDSSSHVEHEGLEQEAKREVLGEEKREEARARGEGAEGSQDGDGHFSQRVHELYQEFLKILQSNLEEFLQAEGLTETQLRDACEKEMEAKGGTGDCFMHTLISSWEFSRQACNSFSWIFFIALVSEFADEGMGSEDEEEEEEGKGGDEEGGDDADGDGASVDDSRPSARGSRLEDEARSTDGVSSSSEVGGRCLLGSHDGRRSRSDSSSNSSSGNSSGRIRRSASPPAAGAVSDDAYAGRGAAVVACRRNLSDGAKDGAAGMPTEQRRPAGSGRAVDSDIPGGLGSKARIHSGDRSGSSQEVDSYRDDGPESQRTGGSATTEAGVGPGIQELSMRAEAKC
ncbi:unnamed protein product, partial [Ectocarpus fasciculatus]